MNIKTRQKLYNESANKLRRYEKGEYYLSSALNIEANEEWVKIDDVIKELDKVWQKINKCKQDKVRANFITKTQVAHYLGRLKKMFTSNSEPKGSTHNKGYEVNQK